MRIRWTVGAVADLEEIYAYLVEHQMPLAKSTIKELYEGILSLERFPRRGSVGSNLSAFGP